MKITKGLFQDCSEADQPEGTYRFAKNMVDANVLGALENEIGFTDLGDIDIPGTIVGIIPMRNSACIFSLDLLNDYIGYVTQNSDKTLTYTNVITDSGLFSLTLGFSKQQPIKGEYQINANGERIVAWVQEGQPPRILNLDNPQINSLKDYELFASNDNPFWTITQNNTGGSLLSGSYIPIIKLKDQSGKEGPWIITGHTVSIVDDALSPTVVFDGCPAGTPTSKSITMVVTDIDESFDTVAFGLIEMKGGVMTAYQVSEVSATDPITYIYTGNETKTELSLDEVLTTPSYILGAKAITQLNNQLILGNVTYEQPVDLQSVANKIKINYTTQTVASAHLNVSQDKGFQSGEVYAFYLIVELNSGGYAAYHIPGRGPTSSERATSTFVTGLAGVKKFQVENTANTSSAVTNMGFWENEGETYPSDFPVGYSWNGANEALAGEKVRHHRFPELETILTGSTQGTRDYVRLGISVSNVIIPDDIQSQIKGWRIGYAKRTYENSTVVAGDLLHLGHKYQTTNVGAAYNLWSTSGGNFRDTTGGAVTLNTTMQRGHALDLLYDKPGVTPTYMKFLYKLQRGGLNTVYSGFANAGAGLVYYVAPIRSAVYTFNYCSPHATKTLISSGTGRAVSLSNYQYIPQDTSVIVGSDTITTINTEEIIHANMSQFSLTTTGFYSNGAISEKDIEDFRTDGSYDDMHQAWYVQYRQAPSSVYNSYKQQQIIFTNERFSGSTTTGSIQDGDVFITIMSYQSNSPYVIPNSATGDDLQNIYLHTFVGEARHNWKLRYEDGTVEGKFFPKTDVAAYFDTDFRLTIHPTDRKNILNYNTDYDLQSEAAAVIIEDIDDFASSGPTTILWSAIGSNDSTETAWRTFPANQRYTMNKNRGELTNLQGIGNRALIIHLEDSIFVTKTNLSLTTNEGEDVNIGAVELFSVTPEELVTSEGGYGGTQHAHSCKMTKAGYFFVDAKQGKCFLYSGKLHEISANGMRSFFRDTLYPGVTHDNAFDQTGYVAGYDEYYNRLLLTKKAGDQSFTISYNPVKGTWVSFHDYHLKNLLTLNDGSLYTFDLGKAYRLNTGVRGVYLGATVYPSYVDVVHNPNPDTDKVFSELEWQSRVYDTNNKQIWDETLTHISAWSQDKCTGRIGISRLSNVNLFQPSNVRNHGQSWYFNNVYDIATDTDFLLGFYDNYTIDSTKLNSNAVWFQKRKFIDKYLICRLEYSNVLNRRFLLLDYGASMRLSPI